MVQRRETARRARPADLLAYPRLTGTRFVCTRFIEKQRDSATPRIDVELGEGGRTTSASQDFADELLRPDLMFIISNWLRAGTVLASLLFLGPACSSEKDDDEVELTWECWADTSNGNCECIGSGPLEDSERGGTNIEEVDDCNGRDVCFSYFDEFFENEA